MSAGQKGNIQFGTIKEHSLGKADSDPPRESVPTQQDIPGTTVQKGRVNARPEPRFWTQHRTQHKPVVVSADHTRNKHTGNTTRYAHIRYNPPILRPGTQVWLRNRFLSNKAAGISASLLPKWKGPFRVTRNIGQVYWLDQPRVAGPTTCLPCPIPPPFLFCFFVHEKQGQIVLQDGSTPASVPVPRDPRGLRPSPNSGLRPSPNSGLRPRPNSGLRSNHSFGLRSTLDFGPRSGSTLDFGPRSGPTFGRSSGTVGRYPDISGRLTFPTVIPVSTPAGEELAVAGVGQGLCGRMS
ncbi:hypothetical protein M8J75_015654 [Diaphorina citri]|nr:hypothetical protein M8J75_015654 [Diaphorina citri]